MSFAQRVQRLQAEALTREDGWLARQLYRLLGLAAPDAESGGGHGAAAGSLADDGSSPSHDREPRAGGGELGAGGSSVRQAVNRSPAAGVAVLQGVNGSGRLPEDEPEVARHVAPANGKRRLVAQRMARKRRAVSPPHLSEVPPRLVASIKEEGDLALCVIPSVTLGGAGATEGDMALAASQRAIAPGAGAPGTQDQEVALLSVAEALQLAAILRLVLQALEARVATPVTEPAAAALSSADATLGAAAALGAGAAAALGAGAAAGVVRGSDMWFGDVYTCYATPLDIHLSADIKEKIWAGDYVELLPLLDGYREALARSFKKEGAKKADVERRLFPRNFSNWSQAFTILAFVIGEKAPHLCSSLFKYQDMIGFAYRKYGGMGWWAYDEQFRQRKAIHKQISWDMKDVDLWLELARAEGPSSFSRGIDGGASSSTPGGSQLGVCWSFNDSQCRFHNCRFRHECSFCGGLHSRVKCFY
ncbi:uncharacterized protein LOC142503719 [Ascaphus truei]|uniref:uncharacterized protein LOC142503719 n=1 Tax=Ascaphus truei TaxID=8439 RepID=UPI003F59BDD8